MTIFNVVDFILDLGTENQRRLAGEFFNRFFHMANLAAGMERRDLELLQRRLNFNDGVVRNWPAKWRT